MPGPKPDPHSGRSKRRGIKLTAASGKVPKCPRNLGPAGERMWKRVVRALRERKAIGFLHADSLERACKLADEIDSLEREIAKKGLTDVNPNGIEYLRPQVKQLNTCRRMIQFYEKEFGLTAAADERLRGAPEPEQEDDALDMLKAFGAAG